jgi:hypothetical protein
MRFASILFACLAIAGCSSDDDKGTTTPPVNACIAAGGKCHDDPFALCAPGDEKATDPSRATACGKSVGEDKHDIPCCLPGLPQDTGVPDTGSADADAASDSSSDVSSDASDGATAETSSSDASDAADAD